MLTIALRWQSAGGAGWCVNLNIKVDRVDLNQWYIDTEMTMKMLPHCHTLTGYSPHHLPRHLSLTLPGSELS